GVSEDSYVHGVSGVAYSVGTALGLILLGVLSAERLRSLSLRTITDYLALRYDSKLVRGLAAGFSIVAVTGIVAAQVNAAVGAVVAVVLFIAYTVFAGMWGVALTDAVQVVIVVIGVPIAAIAGLRAAGGFDGLRAFAESNAEIAGADYFSPVGMGVMAVLGI